MDKAREAALLAIKPDAESSTPLYLQVASKLSSAISAGLWQADEALPSERVLCEILEISRVTARKAMDILFEQGLIVRRQGSGTYIAPRLVQPLSRLTSFSEEIRNRGFAPASRWLSRIISIASQEEVLRLGLSPAATVARIKRLRMADNTVMAVETSTLPSRYLPDPTAMGDSLYSWLDSRSTPVTRALQHIKAINASDEIAQLAGIPSGSAMLMITRIGYLESGLPVELTYSYCRNDYYDFVAELRR
ncbi:GntR family transcriptional regulator [Chitinimonas sp. BJB300]|uniref:GntR family transcriptional regulator n=1 Tax=Chitinimonas sp. BJB300 TaxID=1559339 RepID=UPI000C0FB66E|nr:GntR family transcriptional regulator [Chitinimonas sp. BJB300]PHV12257.1 GntR family transcriptional regulator [Chitinimonas sp. BJB300]TSJ84768.1 GntR family transcriptional regulator [Chitinimonas sp. BJB300]